MSDNFQQTVDLREQAERRRRGISPKKNSAPIEKVYADGADGRPGPDFKTISRPKTSGPGYGPVKAGLFILAAVFIFAAVYYLFFRQPDSADTAVKNQNWYAVKLVDGTIYYGQVADPKAEPVIVKNVYYNYDQAKLTNAAKDQYKTIEETGNIRLVKRGQETVGGDGTMLFYHVNILLLEALKPESKVLKAILEYEK